MSTNIEELIKLNKLATIASSRKRIIILDPEKEYEGFKEIEGNIQYDDEKWELEDQIQEFVDQLSKNNYLNNEDKILKIYEKLCLSYTYDDNILSYMDRNEEGFVLPDFYARKLDNDTRETWKKNRSQHERRVCYEVSRYLAKALEEIFKENEDYNITILWDKGLTHYFVALSCKDYSLTLDLDDFEGIKDLTRVKTGLTIEGIKILDDKKGKFNCALDKFNEGKSKYAANKAEHDVVHYIEELQNSEENQNIEEKYPDDALYFKYVMEIVKDEYDLDSQGIYEFIKEIVDVRIGPENRKKVWKLIKGNTINEDRKMRCLVIDIGNQKYIIDVKKKIFRPFDEKEFEYEDSEFKRYGDVTNPKYIEIMSSKSLRYNGK